MSMRDIAVSFQSREQSGLIAARCSQIRITQTAESSWNACSRLGRSHKSRSRVERLRALSCITPPGLSGSTMWFRLSPVSSGGIGAAIGRRFLTGNHAVRASVHSKPATMAGQPLRIAPSQTARDFKGVVRYYRHEAVVSGWELVSELPGRLRLRNLALLRRTPLCRAIDRELTSVLGIERFKTNALTGTLLLHHDPKLLTRDQVIEILDSALIRAETSATPDQPDMNLPVCTASLPLAAAAQFAARPFYQPRGRVCLFLHPTLKEARRVLLEEKRLGVDALDAVVVAGCSAPCPFSRGRFAAGV